MALKEVRVKACLTRDFRKNERTLYDELRRSRGEWRGAPNKNEVYVFVSTSGRQILFVSGLRNVTTHPGTRYEATQEQLEFRGARIEGGTYDDKMLANYARDCGYRLIGIPTLEEWYVEWRAARYAK